MEVPSLHLSKTLLHPHQDLFYPTPLHLRLPIPLPDSLADSLPPHPSLLQSQNSTLSHFVTLPLLLPRRLTYPIPQLFRLSRPNPLILPPIVIDTDNPILRIQLYPNKVSQDTLPGSICRSKARPKSEVDCPNISEIQVQLSELSLDGNIGNH